MCDHIFLYLTEWQHCFIKSRSCVTHLTLTHNYWAKSFDNGCQVNVAFLDFSKSFDGVSHSVLLKTLCSFGVSGSLPRWCGSYSNRSEAKSVNWWLIQWWCIFILVGKLPWAPQGFLLGTLFLIILISDLPSVVLPCNTIALYVDDYKSLRTIDFGEDLELFQQDLENLERWSTLNSMELNVKKCKTMKISRKKHPFASSFFLKKHWVGGSRLIQGSGCFYWPSLNLELPCELCCFQCK